MGEMLFLDYGQYGDRVYLTGRSNKAWSYDSEHGVIPLLPEKVASKADEPNYIIKAWELPSGEWNATVTARALECNFLGEYQFVDNPFSIRDFLYEGRTYQVKYFIARPLQPSWSGSPYFEQEINLYCIE